MNQSKVGMVYIKHLDFKEGEIYMSRSLKLLDFVLFSVLVAGVFALLGSSNVYAAGAPPTVGKFIAPIMYLGAFALLANGLMHLDPERKKADMRVVGVITATAGVMWWPFLIAMSVVQGLGALTNFITGLAGMYAFFFIALGILEIFDFPNKKSLGPIAILIGWLTLAYGIFFIFTTNPAGTGTWVYHFSIMFVWFVAMNAAGFMLQGRFPEKTTGWIVTFAALYTFAIPALFWSMPPGMRGPF